MNGDEQPQVEPKSSVKITTNAKGMAQVDVKVYEGATEEEMQATKDLAVKVYTATISELGQRAEFERDLRQ